MTSPPHPAFLPDHVSMSGCDAKLRRAKTHQDELRHVVKAALDHSRHEIRSDTDTDGGKRDYVFRIYELPEADPDWSCIIGDCIHNLRSALDHLAFQLPSSAKSVP